MNAGKKNRWAEISRIEREHGYYLIVAGVVGDFCKAVAYRKSAGMDAVEAAESDTVDGAVTEMMDILDARMADMRKARRDGIPTPLEYHEGVCALAAEMRTRLVRYLDVKSRMANETVTPGTLGKFVSAEPGEVLYDLCRIGASLSKVLEYPVPDSRYDGNLGPLNILACVEEIASDGMPVLRFREELVQATEHLPPDRPQPRLAGRRW